MIYVISDDVARKDTQRTTGDLNGRPSDAPDKAPIASRDTCFCCKRGFLIAIAVSSLIVACVCGVLLGFKYSLVNPATGDAGDSRISIIDTFFSSSSINGELSVWNTMLV
jgi:hypothetical protein